MKIRDRIARFIALAMFSFFSFIAILLTIAMITEHLPSEGWAILLLLEFFWFSVAYGMLVTCPCVEMTPEGISVRVLFRTRHYEWGEIQQAGILYRMGRGMHYNQLVLVTAKGSPRKYKDKWFLLRNPFTLIPITVQLTHTAEYVRKHYGPLDFDLSDGRSEQSIVIDN